MASEKLGMVPSQQMHNGLISHPHPHPHTHPHPQLVYPEFACSSQAPHRRSAAAGDPGPKSSTQELTASFLDHRHFYQHHHQPPPAQPQTQTTEFRHQWTNSRSSATPSGGEASEDDDVEDEDDDEDDDNDDEDNSQNIATVAKINHTDANEKFSNSNNNQKLKQLSALVIKEGNSVQIRNGGSNDNNNSIEARNIGEEVYYAHYLHGAEGLSSSSGQKDIMTVENGCGNSKRKESCYSSESQESLRTILSDPLTGALMDDAMILRCGHSFGSGGVQQIIRMKACYTCSQSVSEDSIAPNLSLRLAVQAFRREQQMQVNRTSKKRRERYDQDKGTCGDSVLTEHPRGRGVQFPFAVTDRVIIKGNKRTPQRFVGREAIVTTQCLNGWYVVKTLDNAESVKLQYRSLAKVADDPSSNPLPIKMTPNWL
ncbi:U-box domain-containing 62 [Olea europaea subsp. europaea]|uniref:U-box domain-containing 62 n=2 Tax=Olea europaea subsp. europaea TaxID=158383 RepID=A0A8S0PUR6_OLEEU|nr:U-box domain-containing 62 [Olea europaea subsp. europaea]